MLKVLVVDDSLVIRAKMRGFLIKLGHSVIGEAKDGREAILMYKELNPDLITMDITMPDMDGIEATRRIIDENPDALIIMVTSHGQEKKVMDAIDAGAKGYVLKPIRLEKLDSTIDSVVANYKQ